MAFPSSDTAFEGFRLTRNKPSLLFWLGIVYALSGALTIGLIFPLLTELMTVVEGISGDSNPSEAEAMRMFGLYGQIMIVALPISLIASAIIWPAIVRSVIAPEAKKFGYLRLGRDEINTFIALVLMVLIIFGVCFVAAMIAGFIGAANPSLGIVTAVLMIPVLMVFSIWFSVKFSLTVPITVAEKKIGLRESFKRTKGHFWPLLGIGFIAVILSIGVSLLVNIMAMPFSAMTGGGFGLFSGAGISAATVIGSVGVIVLSIVLASAQALIIYAPFVSAYQQLKPEN